MPAAVVLVSGGLDSATVLALAREQGYRTYALSVDYGQRHRAELEAAFRVARALGAAEHKVARVDLRAFGGSALTDAALDVPTTGVRAGVIPVTYVPARNTVFLSLALAYAEVREADAILFGANVIDYSGYPDCRPEYVSAFETIANLATRAGVQGRRLRVAAPLVALSKAEIIREGARLGVDFASTVSCYQAEADGRACGVCDACRLRRAGFEAAGLADPTRYRQA
jgi:7-cyano-7-deazaguanine synthase